MAPKYLYKILSMDDWNKSQGLQHLKLSVQDADFIHLATEDQLERIIEKYWNNVSQFVVLKIRTSELTGNLEHESNPGGTNKYYHLYEGSIPLSSIESINRTSLS